MANKKITDLTELTSLADDDKFEVVDTSTNTSCYIQASYLRPVFLATPLTSVNWDGDTKTEANRATIDLSAEFGVPAGVKAVMVDVQAVCAQAANYIRFGPTSSFSWALTAKAGVAGGTATVSNTVPCDANGDIYCYVSAGGTITTQMWIHGYWL
jgi:hypothetical protein